jgi:hypothetical protein
MVSMSPHEYDRWRDEHTWDPSRGTDLVIQEDLAAAAWIGPLLVPGSFEVQMMTPRGFEAYARIFFPFPGEGAGREFTRWTEIARRSGRTAHALMEAKTIVAGPAGHEPAGGGAGKPQGQKEPSTSRAQIRKPLARRVPGGRCPVRNRQAKSPPGARSLPEPGPAQPGHRQYCCH